jgi:AraC-like DNA-binding protein
VLGAGHFICHPDFHLKRKDYKCYLIKLTLDGAGFLDYQGKQYELSIMLLDCNLLYEYYSYNGSAWDNIWIHYNGSSSQQYFNIIHENYGPVIEMHKSSLIRNLMDTMIGLMENEDSQFEIKASQLIVEILTSVLLGTTAHTKSLAKSGITDYIETALTFIEKNYSANITVEDVAHAANISMFHFVRQFKKHIGFTPYEYLVKYRMNKAKSLLLHSRQSIEQIADQVGFRDAPTFIRAFK